MWQEFPTNANFIIGQSEQHCMAVGVAVTTMAMLRAFFGGQVPAAEIWASTGQSTIDSLQISERAWWRGSRHLRVMLVIDQNLSISPDSGHVARNVNSNMGTKRLEIGSLYDIKLNWDPWDGECGRRMMLERSDTYPTKFSSSIRWSIFRLRRYFTGG